MKVFWLRGAWSISIIPALYSPSLFILPKSVYLGAAAFYYHRSSEAFFNKSEIDLSGPGAATTTASIPAGLFATRGWMSRHNHCLMICDSLYPIFLFGAKRR